MRRVFWGGSRGGIDRNHHQRDAGRGQNRGWYVSEGSAWGAGLVLVLGCGMQILDGGGVGVGVSGRPGTRRRTRLLLGRCCGGGWGRPGNRGVVGVSLLGWGWREEDGGVRLEVMAGEGDLC